MTEYGYQDAVFNWIRNILDLGVFTTDAQLRIMTWNRWLEIHSHITYPQVIGRNLLEVFPDLEERRAYRYYQQALEGQVYTLSHRFHRYLLPMPAPDEYNGYFERMQQTAQIAPLSSGDKVIGTITKIEDVTERVVREILLKKELEISENAQRLIKKERDLAQHYLDIAGVMLLALDEKGDITLINKRGCQILGCRQEELIGKNWFEIFLPEKDVEGVKEAFSALMRGEIEPYREYENLIKTFSGEIKIIKWNNTILRDESGKIIGTLSSGEDITEKKRLEDTLKAMSITDELTGLYNRRGFIALSQQQLKIAERAGNSMLLFFADLDNMKWINDTFGHKIGDRALIKTAQILKETFRESDIVGRLGGDEFCVLAIDARQTYARALYERLKENIKRYNSNNDDLFQISISLGFSRFDPDSPKDLDELISEADKMMYEEKNNKKQSVINYKKEVAG